MLSLPQHPLFRRARHSLRRKEFLCPNCLCWNDYQLACSACWLKIEDDNLINSEDTCRRCRAQHSNVSRALCLGCGAAALHTAYHEHPAHVLGTLRQEDFSSFLNSTDAAGDAPARNMLGYAFDNGASLVCVLNLSEFTKNIVGHTEAFWKVETVWVDAADNGSPQVLANSLKEAANQLIQRAGLTDRQREEIRLCVRQQQLPSSIMHDLEMRFGLIEYGVEVAELLGGEMATKQEVIGRVGQAWKITKLISELTIGVKATREGAIKQLVSISGPAVPALIDMLTDNFWFVRMNAARTLGLIGDSSEVPAFVENATCQYALDRHLTTSAVPALIATLNDSDRQVRESAAEALGKIGVPALSPLIDTLKDRETAMPVCAAIALKKIGSPAMPALLAAFNHWHSSARENIAEVLGLMGDAAAVPALVDTLKYKDSPIRPSVTKALKRIGNGHALSALKDADKRFHRANDCGLCLAVSDLNTQATAKSSPSNSRQQRR